MGQSGLNGEKLKYDIGFVGGEIEAWKETKTESCGKVQLEE